MAGRSLVGQATSGSSQFTVPDGLGMPRDRQGIESPAGEAMLVVINGD